MGPPPASSNESPLARQLAELTVEGELFTKLKGGKVQCHACAHRCSLKADQAGLCKVRFNSEGALRVPHGYTGGLQDDPIEKKPFYHVRPGLRTLSFGMLGCNLHCDFCQNWLSSQTLKDAEAGASPRPVTAKAIVERAQERGCEGLTSTYNEPLISTEWAVSVFKLAKEAGLVTSYVSNGHATPEALEYLIPWLDYINVDLKSFQEENYTRLGGKLEAVKESLATLVESKVWVEVTTLVVPGFNDSDDELRSIASFLAGLSSDIPWHVTAFHSDYKMKGTPSTQPQSLMKAYRIARRAGLSYAYPGNLPGQFDNLESTLCPSCGTVCVERVGFLIRANHLADTQGMCPGCGRQIPGIWDPPRSPQGGSRLSRWRSNTDRNHPSRGAVQVVR